MFKRRNEYFNRLFPLFIFKDIVSLNINIICIFSLFNFQLVNLHVYIRNFMNISVKKSPFKNYSLLPSLITFFLGHVFSLFSSNSISIRSFFLFHNIYTCKRILLSFSSFGVCFGYERCVGDIGERLDFGLFF